MSKSATAPPARILSISGDPATVALSARVLAVLERRTGQPVSALFHLIVGRASGLLALLLGLAQPTSDQQPRCPTSAEAAAALLADGLCRPRRAPFGLAFGLGKTAEPFLTTAASPLAQAELCAAVTDLAVPVFDTAQTRPFLFRSWKAQGCIPARARARAPRFSRPRHPARGAAPSRHRPRRGAGAQPSGFRGGRGRGVRPRPGEPRQPARAAAVPARRQPADPVAQLRPARARALRPPAPARTARIMPRCGTGRASRR